ncbi:hypothetical protein F7734_56315 [Scytonema sp. UIC 10036]|uniref:hypothetical protein n=1 Tax=Scytonema sp. UIC 10036 TaxID=2304196 RepID=UPI0012DA9AF4|nr:hypothetical protein [Scytonema sp. UIC 10036]MUH01143.1 hypothetical protein [Scytonema sp. UIC 10036]
MIHDVHLPDLTRERLTDVVVLQIWLLFYAASNSTLDQTDCGDRLNRCPRFRGRGEKIAKWIGVKTRIQLLKLGCLLP